MNQEIELFFQKSVEDGVFPGCNAAVIYHDTVDYYCVGNRTLLPSPISNHLTTRYDLASLTKVVSTTMVIWRLVQKGMLDIDMHVDRIVPELIHHQITIKHLLTHSSGLPADIEWKPDMTKQKILNYIYHAPLVFSSGSKVLYSDLGFILLGEIIERVTNLSLDLIAKYEVFDPLGMQETTYCPDNQIKKLCAPTEISPHYHYLLQGEVHDHKAYVMNGIAGHAGVFSTITDMVKYASMLLHDGMSENGRFLETWQIEAFYHNYSQHGQIARGIGFLAKDKRGPFSSLNTAKSFMHTGFTGTSILVDQGLDLAIIVLSNRVHPTRDNQQMIAWRKKMHHFIIEKTLQRNQ